MCRNWIGFGLLVLAGSARGDTSFTDVTYEITSPLAAAKAIAPGDFDNDGWPDLVMAETLTDRLVLLHNDGPGGFDKRSLRVSLSGRNGLGTIFGDIDNDGDLDLFVAKGSWNGSGLDRLLRNDRGTFTDVTHQAGFQDTLPTDNAIWLDYDRDGWLDLYVGHWRFAEPNPGLQNSLHRNNGDGTFVQTTRAAGLDIDLHPGGSHQGGGSANGISAGDFNDDAWPDLYLGIFNSPNRLFLNDGQGSFSDNTTPEVASPGEASAAAVGDIDNDGDLDIFQAVGGAGATSRPTVLLNIGSGRFADVTDGAGLGALVGENLRGGLLQDFDNDGDLDLLTGRLQRDPTRTEALLFNNDGNGFFTDQTERAGFEAGGNIPFTLDYDLDGFLDLGTIFAAPNLDHEKLLLYRNNGNDNHWLRLELVGVESNRSGIGARVVAIAGSLRQVRELLGGKGKTQDELVVHFGLADRTQVDSLVIRWPSGRMDVLTDIPSDQKVRVIEGSQTYHTVNPTLWHGDLPDTVWVDQSHVFSSTVIPALFESESRITSVVFNTSGAGDRPVALVASGGGSYTLDTSIRAERNGPLTMSVLIDQETSLGPVWTRLSRQLTALPSSDLPVLEGVGWRAEAASGAEPPAAAQDPMDASRAVTAFQVAPASILGWNVSFTPDERVHPVGYSLRLTFHPGSATGRSLRIAVDSEDGPIGVSLMGAQAQEDRSVDLTEPAWQTVDIPLADIGVVEPIKAISLSGRLEGTFYIDDIRLVAATAPPITAVTESHDSTTPSAFSLSQNYPNPFNPETTIRFDLPYAQEIELSVYNLAAQKVATLAQGYREAGSYSARWDGVDDAGGELASGVYLYRLTVGAEEVTRKLLLLR